MNLAFFLLLFFPITASSTYKTYVCMFFLLSPLHRLATQLLFKYWVCSFSKSIGSFRPKTTHRSLRTTKMGGCSTSRLFPWICFPSKEQVEACDIKTEAYFSLKSIFIKCNTHTHTHTHTHIYIYIYIYLHTYTHTCAFRDASLYLSLSELNRRMQAPSKQDASCQKCHHPPLPPPSLPLMEEGGKEGRHLLLMVSLPKIQLKPL